ncbi:MAG: hypothetical protein RR490_03515, partial [Niameybacter sp.]
MKSRFYKKLLSSALSLALLCNIGVTPVLAITAKDDTITTITSFVALDEDVQQQSVPAGTKLEELNLPSTIVVSTLDTTKEETVDITLKDITWELDPTNDVNNGSNTYDPTGGSYAFTPVIPDGYTVSETIKLPEIWVMVEMKQPLAKDDTFTLTTAEGHELVYKVLTESSDTGTVMLTRMNGT